MLPTGVLRIFPDPKNLDLATKPERYQHPTVYEITCN